MNYPEGGQYIGGCKVSWLIYQDEEKAAQASEIATKEGKRLEREGFDFGMQNVGEMKFVKDGIQVCIP